MHPTMIRPHQRLERKVADYLQAQGLRLIEQHFECPLGHIDLIMQADPTLVFIEVAYRREHSEDSHPPCFRPSKQACIQAAAHQFLRFRPWTVHLPYRFDVLVVSGPMAAPKRITWHKDIFQGYNDRLNDQ